MQVCFHPQSSQAPTLSWYDLPPEVKQLLIAAGNTWEDTAQSEAHIQQALVISNHALDVLVAAYRYFFYKQNNVAALQIADQVIARVQGLEDLPTDWEILAPILHQRKEEPNIRLYLNAYAASGLVRARLGEIEQATLIADRVNTIDDRREFGAATVLHILTHSDDEDDEEES